MAAIRQRRDRRCVHSVLVSFGRVDGEGQENKNGHLFMNASSTRPRPHGRLSKAGRHGQRGRRTSTSLLVAVLLLVACAPATPPTPAVQEVTQGPRGTLRIAWGPEPPGLNAKLFRAGPTEVQEFGAIFNSSLTFMDPGGSPRPLLARTLPTQENRDLIVNTDGTMVTTYRLRENAKWHDGTPLTANDLVFANSVYSDPEIPVVDGSTQALIANVQATDDHTLRIAWKQPYFLAGSLGTRDLVPLPRHLLSEQAQTNKANFATGPDWSANFVGNGPFAVERWDLGSGVIARAFPDWFLGPPKLDRIEFRFIGDPNAILANLLSGEVDFTMSDFISPTLVVSTRDYWVGGGIGYIDAAEATEQYIVFQFREVPDWQRSVTDIRVRKALIHSLDRQTLADVVTAGFGSAADLFLFRSHPVYAEADRASAKYPYDPRRAGALLGEAGWNNQAGGPLRNADGQPLKLTYRRSAAAQAEQDISVVVDNWKAIGVDA